MMSNELYDLWNDPDPRFGQIAAREITGNFFNDPAMFFNMATHPLADRNHFFKYARRRFPFLGYRPIEPVRDARPCTLFGEMEKEFNRFIGTLIHHLDSMKPAEASALADTIALRFPAIADETGQWSRTPHSTVREEDTVRQFMIFVTGQCNLRCPYCFSNDIEHTAISRPQLDAIMDWCEREQVHRITPCGGEPLIYPHLLHLLQRSANAGMKVYFATNFTIPVPDDEIFSGELIEVLYLHLTSALWSNPGLMDIFSRNVEKARERGIRLVARANFESEQTDSTPWLELMEKLGLRELNVALTIPSNDAANSYVDLSAMQRMVPKLEALMDETRRRGINLRMAKPVPPCFFSPERRMEIINNEALRPRCNVSEGGCTRNVCLSPAMSVQPCLGIDSVELKFSTSMSWESMSSGCAAAVRSALGKPLMEQCNGCFLFKRRLCQGACLSYKR